jgi:hypothetical protein
MRHYWIMYQITLSKIFFENCMIPWEKVTSSLDSYFCWSPPVVLGHTVCSICLKYIFHTVVGRFIPLGITVNYGDLQFAEWITVARRSEMSAEWKVRFAICIASVAIQAFTKLLFSFSDVLKTTNCTRPYHRMESMRKSYILSWLLFVLISSSRIRTYSLLYWPKVYIPHCGGPFFLMSLGIIPFSTIFWRKNHGGPSIWDVCWVEGQVCNLHRFCGHSSVY